jgi:hypothetical protein
LSNIINGKIKGDEAHTACSMHGEMKMPVKFHPENLKGRDHLGDML